MFGYRTNLVIADGDGYVDGSQLRRQLAAVALDVHPLPYRRRRKFQLLQAVPASDTPAGSPMRQRSLRVCARSTSILLPVARTRPDPPRLRAVLFGRGYEQSDRRSAGKAGIQPELALVVGVLNQIADRNINTGQRSNKLTDELTKGDYQTYLANVFQNTLAPRFQVKSDLAYLTGKFKTWAFATKW